MLTISIYDAHHIIGRFVKLYKQVQVVSNCLAFACSMLCCQCLAFLPGNSAEETSSQEGFIFLPQSEIDTRNKAGGDPLLQVECKSTSKDVEKDSLQVHRKYGDIQTKFCKKTVGIRIDSDENKNEFHMEQKASVASYNYKFSPRSHGGDLPAIHRNITSKQLSLMKLLTSPSTSSGMPTLS